MALHKGLRIAVVLCIFVAALSGTHRPALAACTSPAGIGGTITWNGTDSVIWCDGTNWYALKNAAGSSGSAGYIQFSNGSGGFSNSGTTAGQQLFWDDTNKRLGIGTASPASALHIVGAENDGTASALRVVSGAQTMLIDGNEIDALAGESLYLQNNVTAANTSGSDWRVGTYANQKINPLSTSSSTFSAFEAQAFPNGSSDITTVYGGRGAVSTNGTNAVTNALGWSGLTYVPTASTITNAYGTRGEIRTNHTSASVTNAYAGSFSVTKTLGTITNGMGVYIGTIEGTNKWGLYSSDSTANNYFAGNVGIGTVTPAQRLAVNTTNTTATSGSVATARMDLTASPAADSSATYYAHFNRADLSGSSNVTGTISSTHSYSTHSGAGTLYAGYGATSAMDNLGVGTASNAYGAYNYARANSAGTITNGYGSYSAALTNNASTTMTTGIGAYNTAYTTLGTMTNAYGSYNIAQNSAPTTMGLAMASREHVIVGSGSTVTSAYGVGIYLSNAGTVTNWYGLYIPALSGTAPTTSRYPIYVADTGSNYFAGSVLVGRTTASSASTPAGLTIQHAYGVNYGLVLVSDNIGSSSIARFDNPNGNVGSIVISGTTTTYTTSSDRRLKENITDTQGALNRVMQIPVHDFSFKSDATHAKQTGFIAQELAKVMPEAVATNGDDGQAPLSDGKQGWSVDYGRVTPLLLKAIQELKAANDNLRSTVEAQGHEIEALKAARP